MIEQPNVFRRMNVCFILVSGLLRRRSFYFLIFLVRNRWKWRREETLLPPVPIATFTSSPLIVRGYSSFDPRLILAMEALLTQREKDTELFSDPWRHKDGMKWRTFFFVFLSRCRCRKAEISITKARKRMSVSSRADGPMCVFFFRLFSTLSCDLLCYVNSVCVCVCQRRLRAAAAINCYHKERRCWRADAFLART